MALPKIIFKTHSIKICTIEVKNILILICHDFTLSLKNKSLFLIFFIPLFVFISEQFLDGAKSDNEKLKIALIEPDNYALKIVQAIKAAEKNIELTWAKNEDEGRLLLKEHKIQGLLTKTANPTDQLSLTVLRRDSPQTLAILQIFSGLQRAAEKNNPSWISDIKSVREGGMQKQTFPTWILMLVLLVGFIILPSQVAEEKEKKLILALLQTPVTEGQWLVGKVLFGIFLTLVSVFLLLAFSYFSQEMSVFSLGFIVLGSFCFCAFGIFLGFLCRYQAGARTLGLIFYVPLLMPSALSDFSKKWTSIAPFLPSYQFYAPLRSMLFEGVEAPQLAFPVFYLLILGSMALCLSYLLMKKRWLM